MSLPHGWISPDGRLHEKDIDHLETDVGGTWPEAFKRGWLRVGEAFGTPFVHGTAEGIFQNRNVIAFMLSPGERIRVQLHPGMHGAILTPEELLDADDASALRVRTHYSTHLARREQVFVRAHGRKIGVYPGGKYYRERQFPPGRCEPGTSRTINVGRGHKAVICRPRGKTTTRTQSILHPRTEREWKKLGLSGRMRRRA